MREQANGNKDGPVYDLYGVLVHKGQSVNYGHYLAYVKHKGNQWIRINDEMCTPVAPHTVLEDKAYLLFYSRRVVRTESLL